MIPLAFISNRKQDVPITAQELIGREVKILKTSGKDVPKVQGKIIDETANTLIVDINGKCKVFPKATSVFEINGYKITGKTLVGKPEDRTKKFLQ